MEGRDVDVICQVMRKKIYGTADRSKALQDDSYRSRCKVTCLSQVKDNLVFELVFPNKKQDDMDDKKREVKNETPSTKIE